MEKSINIKEIKNKINILCNTIVKIGKEENLQSWIEISEKWRNESDDYIYKIKIYEQKLLDLYKKANMLF